MKLWIYYRYIDVSIVTDVPHLKRRHAEDADLIFLVNCGMNTDSQKSYGLFPCLNINNPKAVANFIEKNFLKKKTGQNITLMVNGRYITLKPFIAGLLTTGINGMITTLKDCNTAKEIDIRIKI